MKKLFFIALTALMTVNLSAQNVVVGAKAPEIENNKPDGTPLKLSSLKGNVVLIDFWASWCYPCRKKNPEVVALYNKYQGKKWNKTTKGFTVFNVSLDNNKDAWVKAIASDNLSWPNHVSDLKGWNSAPAAVYGIRSIPQTVLIDEQGFVIARNPTIAFIEEFLNKRLATSSSTKKTTK
ncbi:MAG: TlpA family protein disulfide reductase [Sphingobacteriales bacterium]|jgi:thiol-disulfide isomerase/thioredoxin|nr:MAG: TlpA family protein disulfide reductase [Sphingobacteriales bacterium]